MKWYGIFVNATDSEIQISVVCEGETSIWKQFSLEPYAKIKTMVLPGKATVRDVNGKELYTSVTFVGNPEGKYATGNERTVYFLVTKTGIYPIPREYRTNWKEHFQEITR